MRNRLSQSALAALAVSLLTLLCSVSAENDTRTTAGEQLGSDLPWSAKKFCPVQKDCDECDRGCDIGQADKYIKEENECAQSLAKLQEHIKRKNQGEAVPSIEEECAYAACLPRMLKQYCGLGLRGSDIAKLQQMSSLVDKERKTYAKVHQKYMQAKAAFERSPEAVYHARLEKARKLISREREKALKVRQYNHELKEYLDSMSFRRSSQKVKQFHLSNEEMTERHRFWVAESQALALAVRTSPEVLKRARDRLTDIMRQAEADAELVHVLQSTGMTKEKQVRLVKVLKDEVKAELAALETINVQKRREMEFLGTASKELYNLLTDVLNDVRGRKIEVRCGSTELGKRVGEAVLV